MDSDAVTVSLSDIQVPHTTLPDGLVLGDEIGKGSNNKVFEATWGDMECVFRTPRRGGDTQQRGSALAEFKFSLRAAQIGAGPEVYKAWYARHAKGNWPSGLYMICERFDDDLEGMLCENEELRADASHPPTRAQVQRGILECTRRLAEERIFVFDIKPSNVVVSNMDDEPVVRIIDYGRDFCEWEGDPLLACPLLTLCRRHCKNDEAVLTEVLHILMLILLSSTLTVTLHATRHDHGMTASMRRDVHPLVDVVADTIDHMQGQYLAIVRCMLRMDDVRGVLRHYHGRRNAGTRRTLKFAVGDAAHTNG